MTTPSGQPVLVLWSAGDGPGLFYEPTVIDPTTGAIYQGWIFMNPQPVDFFGGLLPPEYAQVTGAFSPSELDELALVVHEALLASE